MTILRAVRILICISRFNSFGDLSDFSKKYNDVLYNRLNITNIQKFQSLIPLPILSCRTSLQRYELFVQSAYHPL